MPLRTVFADPVTNKATPGGAVLSTIVGTAVFTKVSVCTVPPTVE